MKVLLIFFLTMVMHAIGFCLAIKDPFSDVCLKRPFVFHLPTDVLFKLHSPVFLDEEVCVCVWGGCGGNLGHSYPEIFRSTYFNCRRKWQFLCCILKAQLLLNSSQVANYCTYGKICNQNTLSLQYSNFLSV